MHGLRNRIREIKFREYDLGKTSGSRSLGFSEKDRKSCF